MPDRLNIYYDSARMDTQIAAGRHRELIGGGWDVVGQLLYDFLLREGLQATDRFLDVGCGSLRAGVKLVPYLEPGNYFGIDLVQGLMDAGYEKEIIPAGLANRLPRENLRATDSFDAEFAAPIDIALAASVFSHLPFNHIRWCLDRLAPVVRSGGRFYATYLEIPDDVPFGEPYPQEPTGTVSQPAMDPFHYRPDDLLHAAFGTDWTARIIGPWANNRRGQQMALFARR